MAKHNWDDLERRFLLSEWLTLGEMSTKLKMSDTQLRKEAAKRQWVKRREEMQQGALAAMDRSLKFKLSKEAAKRIPALLELADTLKGKALQTLSQEGLRLLPADALRALRDGANIELELLGPKKERTAIETEPTSGPEQNIIDEKPRENLDRKLRRLIAGKDKGKDSGGDK